MNIRKTLLLTLVIAIASLGLTLTGCEQKSDHPTSDHPDTEAAPAEHPEGEHPTTEKTLCPKCGEVAGSEACCTQKAVEETKAASEEAAPEHPKGEHPK